MSNEELQQRGYITAGGLRGDAYGSFEEMKLGSTTLTALISAGLQVTLPTAHPYTPSLYKAPKKPSGLKPDNLYLDRVDGQLSVCAVCEVKPEKEFQGNKGPDNERKAMEQAVCSAAALGAPLALASNGIRHRYVNVNKTIEQGVLVEIQETRSLNPGVLEDLLAPTPGAVKDPTELAERVWQLIWHATKAEPKECLLTFVEMFVLKFLSDNLPAKVLPADLRFYKLTGDPAKFQADTGMTEVEYYVNRIRPKIKEIFPDNTFCADEEVPALFGLETVVSKTSIINGFVFLQTGQTSHESYNSTFRAVIDEFNRYGPLTNIDPEFKIRLYETFLRKSARQQRLGQFFTPRNVVKSMISMAQLSKLPKDSVVLDPAAGVGGFILEPLMYPDALQNNLTIQSGKPVRNVRTVGLDVDADLHILAKANMLLHIAELVRDPASTPPALNRAMAETFVLMDANKTLGSLLNPPIESVDVILTNPPYVTRGSAIYKDTIKTIQGQRNGVLLPDYYNGAGLGVEALFMRYIAGALKPGGRAFVIVPQGLLNRTEPGPKRQLLDECNVLASIQLPRNTFFNTAQKTYILVLEKRHSPADTRPDVLCGLARSIGESLDWRRIPTPADNDLALIAEAFVARDNHQAIDDSAQAITRVVPAEEFSSDSRWDVVRHWDDADLVQLGISASPVDRIEFIEESRLTLAQLLDDLEEAKKELEVLTAGPVVLASIHR